VSRGVGLIYSAGILALLGWLVVGCAAVRPTSLIRMHGGDAEADLLRSELLAFEN
jgi:hypothetical protein